MATQIDWIWMDNQEPEFEDVYLVLWEGRRAGFTGTFYALLMYEDGVWEKNDVMQDYKDVSILAYAELDHPKAVLARLEAEL